MSAPEPVRCELLPWDTDFFHCRMGRVCVNRLRPEQMGEIDRWVGDHRIQCLYFLSDADDPLTVRTAERHGFALVDIRITLECKFATLPERNSPPLAPGFSIRPAQTEDIPGLQAIARTAHRATRFFNDPQFSRERVEDFYSTWIELEIQGRAQRVLTVASATNQPMGYLSCHVGPSGETGQIGLVGVASEVRGKGLGRNLVLAALNWFKTQQVKEVTVVAQGNNRPAQRLYQQCGFLNRNLQLWYHKWYPISD